MAWIKHSSSGIFLFPTQPGRAKAYSLQFLQMEWLWFLVESVEELDHDGDCEVIAKGKRYDPTSPGRIGIYKWNGRTYRLWWTSPRKGEYVVDAKIYDFDGDGKE